MCQVFICGIQSETGKMRQKIWTHSYGSETLEVCMKLIGEQLNSMLHILINIIFPHFALGYIE